MAANHKWGLSSREALATVHEDLERLCNKVLLYSPLDTKIIEGHRSRERQEELFNKGLSKVKVSRHNMYPSEAVDMAPLVNGQIPWNDRDIWLQFSGFVRGVAAAEGIDIRSGVDWDNDFNAKEHTFFDGPHFQLTRIY